MIKARCDIDLSPGTRGVPESASQGWDRRAVTAARLVSFYRQRPGARSRARRNRIPALS